MLLVHKFPTQPLLLGATSLFGWRLIIFKSLTSRNGCNRGKDGKSGGDEGGGWSWENRLGVWWLSLSLSLWVSSPLITKVGLCRSKHCCFSQHRKDFYSCFVDLILCCLQSARGNHPCLKTWQVMPSGSVLGMCPMPCVRVIAGVFRCPAVLKARSRRHSL